MVALVDGQPRLLNLKQMLEYFIRHRREVVTRRTLFELGKARDRAHILEGLAVAWPILMRLLHLLRRPRVRLRLSRLYCRSIGSPAL